MTTDTPPITALVYTDSTLADRALRRIVSRYEAAGRRLAGVVQRDTPRDGRARCDMTLEDLSTGTAIAISQDRGPNARGCHLDLGEMARAIHLASAALERAPDILVLNKFGRTEAEGGGFRWLIAAAIEAGVPVLIAVPYRNLDPWRSFAGGLAREIHLTGVDDDPALDLLCPDGVAPAPAPLASRDA
jgi:nucleoside-triphosphatase THEP1